MPLRLNVGLSKKVGMPDYGSLGATCNVDVELDATLLQSDLEGFQAHVRRAYAACAQAVNDELARNFAKPSQMHGLTQVNGHSSNGPASSNGHPAPKSTARRATQSQVRALSAIANRRGIDLSRLLADRFHLTTADELGIRTASELIDELKAPAESGGGR